MITKYLLAGLLVFLSSIAFFEPAIAQSGNNSTDQEVNHYIVAIDVSGDMRPLNKNQVITAAIPRLLFDKLDKFDKNLDTRLPTFRPGIDRLSVVYFALTNDTTVTECKKHTGWDMESEYLFTWQEIKNNPILDKQSLQNQLKEWMNRDCRIVPMNQKLYTSLSPIVTAESLVATFVSKQLQQSSGKDLLFDQTFLITATNELYNGDPSRELADYEKGRRTNIPVAHTEGARELSQQLLGDFYIRHYREQ